MRCAGCGYGEDVHDLGTLRCPIETADKNGRRGTFREPQPEARKSWFGMTMPLSPAELKQIAEAADEGKGVALPPQVPARPPLGAGEFAGSQRRQAVGLGRGAIDRGWRVVPLYWRSWLGVEGCGVWLAKGEMRAVATWKRPEGMVGKTTGWTVDVAYAWRIDAGRAPTKLTHTQLEGLIR